MAISFFNTMTRMDEEFQPLVQGEARIYTCGPTVYNFAHIGNFRAYIFEDFLRRTLKYCGFKVVQVMNLTDVDDKTIKGSMNAGMDLDSYTGQFKKAFFEDLQTLSIEKAEYYPEATAHVGEMISLIETLFKKGFAYRSDDGSIYFSVAKFADYGKLARIDMENQRTGLRVKSDEYEKDSVADFALWKAWDENDGKVFWDSPWGKGRPGWHIECSAMSMKYLGPTFDIHTGGIDNMFPHHEDEIAQSEAANSCRFVNYWLHCEHLIVDGQKMSKSLGNFFTLRDLIQKGYSGRELRWVLMGTHYRKKLNFTFESLEHARLMLNKFDGFFKRLKSIAEAKTEGENLLAACEESADKFKAGISSDLNISEALAAVHALQTEANRLMDSGKLSSEGAQQILAKFADFNRVLAVFDLEKSEAEIPQDIKDMAEKRIAAKKAKDYATADAIRLEMKSKGWILEDTPKGTRIIRN